MELAGFQDNKWNDHLFEGNPSVLEGVPIVTHIMIIVIGVGEEQVILGEYIRAAHGDAWQVNTRRVPCLKYVLFIIGKASSGFVAKVQAGFLVSYDF
jgi:hypothetical protein